MTTPDTYDIGDRVKLDITFKDDAGIDVDPDAVRLTLAYPDGNVETWGEGDVDTPIVHEATGYYSAEFTATMSGRHRFRWDANGPGAGSEEGYYYVNLNHLPNALA